MNTSTKKKNNKKLLLIIIPIIVILLLSGTLFAYFSDLASDNVQINSATLKIQGVYSYTLNGQAATQAELQTLNPGDVVVVSGTVTNEGNQSAWVREKVTLASDDETVLSYLQLYSGNISQEQLLGGYSGEVLNVVEGVANTSNKVLDGSTAEGGGGYQYIGGTSYTFYITIYFSVDAPNSCQNKSFSIGVLTQALQFANNNLTEPDETAWASVEAA